MASTSTSPAKSPSTNNTSKLEFINRATTWSTEVEDAYRFQVAGFKDEEEYKQAIGVTTVDRWATTGFVKKLQRRDGMFYYFDKDRECPEQEVTRVRLSKRPEEKNDVSCHVQLM